MDNNTMTMSAASCVLVARLRPATGEIRLAATRVQGQGTTVSVAMGSRVADFRAPIQGGVSVADQTFAPAYKTLDVVRSRSGRPPV